MSTAGYLQDAKNQQKRLAETITSKGITATATEKYKSLVNKVAQIENLKGEERTLENFTNVLSEPKSIVQLEYPDNTPKTLNAKLGSKNLIPYPYTHTTKTLNGITFTVNSDGSVTVSGTATAQAYFKLQQSFSLKKGQYFFSGCPTGGAGGTYSLYLSTADYTFYKADVGNGIYINAESDKTVSIVINIAKDTTVENLVFKPQLELGSTATAYTPYISDLSSVNVTRCGKNLIPYPYYDTTKTQNGVTFTVNTDGSIALSGASTGQATFYFMYGSLSLKKGTTYTFSASGDYNFSGSATLYIYDSKQGQTAYIPLATDKKATFTPNVDIKNTNCYIVLPANRTASGTIKVQLELGSTATTYEPYQGQTYTPTVSGEVTGITNLYPVTTLLTNNAGVVFEQITGGFYKEILPSTDKNGITKVYQPSVDNTIDSNIKPENIKKGVKILGILGTYDGN
jgi:hypothetical protein